MGYKNRNHKQKRVISPSKFARIFASNLDKCGVAYRTKGWVTQRSLAAVKVDNIIYAKFACKVQPENRLQTFCIRYRIDEEPLDFVAFCQYPSQLQAIADMNEAEGMELF